MLIIDSGTGRWLEWVDGLPRPPAALVCTHYFRDHAAGAALAGRQGLLVFVPEGEHTLFAEPELHFLQRDPYVNYTNTWDHFVPIESVAVAGVLRDFEHITVAGLDVEVVPLPGVTITQCGIELELANARRVVFCGEAIHSAGRLARLAPLQYGYMDLPGAIGAVESARELRRRGLAALFPSLGEPIVDDVDGALDDLEANLVRMLEGNPFDQSWRLLERDPLVRISERVWRSTSMAAATTFIQAPSGAVAAIDVGYDAVFAPSGASAPAPHRRRGSVRAAREFLRRTGAERVDVVFVSHYHDDHVAGIPILQRLYGTECWCPDWFADILARPADFAFPCLWPVPCRVDRRLPPDTRVAWEGIEFRFHPISGHTRFSAAISFDVDGLSYAHLGDQYHSMGGWSGGIPASPEVRFDWSRDAFMSGLVYRNGASLTSYVESARWLDEWRPDIVLSGHQAAMRTDDDFFKLAREHGARIAADHRTAMVLGENETHFGLDSWGGWIEPYRNRLARPGVLVVRAVVRNPLAHEASLEVVLVGPAGWVGSRAEQTAGPRQEIAFDLSIEIPDNCRRRPIAVELVAGGMPFGQVAEALVTVGGSGF
jgi:glyoxylase-like metal-dependent hydrolase (beta-lactamase superfamily II)